MKITEKRSITSYAVRNACIDNEWYTCGTCDQYSDMLYRVDELNGTDSESFLNGLASIAQDIFEHSSVDLTCYGCSEDEYIANILYVLTNKCTSFSYEFES